MLLFWGSVVLSSFSEDGTEEEGAWTNSLHFAQTSFLHVPQWLPPTNPRHSDPGHAKIGFVVELFKNIFGFSGKSTRSPNLSLFLSLATVSSQSKKGCVEANKENSRSHVSFSWYDLNKVKMLNFLQNCFVKCVLHFMHDGRAYVKQHSLHASKPHWHWMHWSMFLFVYFVKHTEHSAFIFFNDAFNKTKKNI